MTVGNVWPPSADRTVAPPLPTPTTLVPVEKATSLWVWLDGVTIEPVLAPSFVRISSLPSAVEIRQFSGSLQEMWERSNGPDPAGSTSGLAGQVAPPSVDSSTVSLSPTAKAVVGLTNAIALRPCVAEPTWVHELAESVAVSYTHLRAHE